MLKIDERNRKLVNERLDLINKAQSIIDKMRDNLPHKPLNYAPDKPHKCIKIRDLSAEEQSKIIRMSHKAR